MRLGSQLMLSTLGLISSLVVTNQAHAQVERPPQLVLLAYDGSYNNSVWSQSRQFSLDQRAQGIDTRFTYFINPAYLLWKCPAASTTCKPPPYDRATYYNPPGSTNGKKNVGSAIGWGDDDKDISTRLDNMNGAFEEGHEIGSHAVGHWDGSKWSYSEWVSEFKQFYNILDNVFSINKLKASATYGYNLLFRGRITGFRAPLLGYSQGMYQALPEFGMNYDTSLQDVPNYWPRKNQYGTWNFPLGSIKRPGSARTLPSMDYNFCVNDSAALLQTDPSLASYQAAGFKKNGPKECLFSVKPEQKVALKKSMFESYMNYFNNNYYGNRAPINIGHHFSNWMSGAYYETFFEFAKAVCSKPEVKCVTYQELVQFMEATPAATIQKYRDGAFPKLARPKSSVADRTFDIDLKIAQKGDVFEVEKSGKDKSLSGSRIAIYVNEKLIEKSKLSLKEIEAAAPAESKVSLRAVFLTARGKELQSATHRLSNIGTDRQVFDIESVEALASKGHLQGAHEFDQDKDENIEHFGH